MICHGVLNMQETKYGEEPMENLVITDMRQGFKMRCMVYESITDLVRFFIYNIMYILLYYKSRFTYNALFLCL
jgi:hypothetical protein